MIFGDANDRNKHNIVEHTVLSEFLENRLEQGGSEHVQEGLYMNEQYN